MMPAAEITSPMRAGSRDLLKDSVGTHAHRTVLVLAGIALSFSYVNFAPFPTDLEAYGVYKAKSVGLLPGVSEAFATLLRVCSLPLLIYGIATSPDRKHLGVVIVGVSLLIAIVAVSVAASPDRGVSIQEAVRQVLWISFCLGLALVIRTTERLIYTLMASIAVVLFVSYIGVFAIPLRAIHNASSFTNLDVALSGSWRGAFSHKNFGAGIVMQLLTIGLLMIWYRKNQMIGFAAASASFLFIYMSDSRTGMLTPFLSIILGSALMLVSRNRFAYGACALAIVCFTAAFPFLVLYWLYPSYGLAFSNRNQIWSVVLRFVDLHPLAGGGYGTLFNPFSDINRFDNSWIILMGQAHNGFLNLLGQVGYISTGVVMILMLLTLLTLREIIVRPGERSDYNKICLFLFLNCTIRSLQEPDLLTNRAHWIVWLLISLITVVVWSHGSASGAQGRRTANAACAPELTR